MSGRMIICTTLELACCFALSVLLPYTFIVVETLLCRMSIC